MTSMSNSTSRPGDPVTTGLPENLYYTIFKNERPKGSFQTIQNRLSRSKALCESLADHLYNRALAEEDYVKSLQKLARKPALSLNPTASSSSGIRGMGSNSNDSSSQLTDSSQIPLRTNIESDLSHTIDAHENFSRTLVEDVVKPLRESVRKGDAQLKDIDSHIVPIVKDYDDALGRVVKAQNKQSKKLNIFQGDLTRATTAWNAEAERLFSTYQKIDQARLNNFKEALVKYLTMCNDIGRDRMESAEATLVHAISFETETDMRIFAMKYGDVAHVEQAQTMPIQQQQQQQPSTPREQRQQPEPQAQPKQQQQQQQQQRPIPAPRSESLNNIHDPFTNNNNIQNGHQDHLESVLPQRDNQDQQEQLEQTQSTTQQPQSQLPTIAKPSETFSNRQQGNSYNSYTTPETLQIPPPSPEKPKHSPTTSLPPGRSQHDEAASITSATSGGGGGGGFFSAFKSPRRPRSATKASSNYSSIDDDNLAPSSANHQHQQNDKSSPSSNANITGSGASNNNEGLGRRSSFLPSIMRRKNSRTAPHTGPPVPMLTDDNRRYSTASRETSNVAPTLPLPATVDEEGFSLPPEGHDKSPWERSANGTEVLAESPTQNKRDGPAGFDSNNNTNTTNKDTDLGSSTAESEFGQLSQNNRDSTMLGNNRVSTVNIQHAPITETEGDQQAALERVRSQLLSSRSQQSQPSLSRRATRGRRGERQNTNSTIGGAGVGGAIAEQQQQEQPKEEQSTIPDEMPLGQAQALAAQRAAAATTIESSTSQNDETQTQQLQPSNITTSIPPETPMSTTSFAPSTAPSTSFTQDDPSKPQTSTSAANNDVNNINRALNESPVAMTPTATGIIDGTMPGAAAATTTVIPQQGRSRTMSLLSASSSPHTIAAGEKNPFENPTSPGIRASVIETVHLVVSNGKVERIMVTGDISLSAQQVDIATLGKKVLLNIRAPQGTFAKSAPNRNFLEQEAGQEEDDVYTLDIQKLSSATDSSGRSVAVYKYQVSINESDSDAMLKYVPVIVEPQWKCEDTKTSFLTQYRSNDACTFIEKVDERSPTQVEGGTTKIDNVILDTSVIDSNISSIQSKPEGVWSSEKRRMRWKLGTLEPNSPAQKVLARFFVDKASTPQPVSVKWRVPGKLFTPLTLELTTIDSQSPTPQFEEVVTYITAGKHLVS